MNKGNGAGRSLWVTTVGDQQRADAVESMTLDELKTGLRQASAMLRESRDDAMKRGAESNRLREALAAIDVKLRGKMVRVQQFEAIAEIVLNALKPG